MSDTDIVTKLRLTHFLDGREIGMNAQRAEAANEIERLQEELRLAKLPHLAAHDAATKEIERLQQRERDMQTAINALCEDAEETEQELAAARAECERLNDAITRIMYIAQGAGGADE